jgi:transcription factor E2F3
LKRKATCVENNAAESSDCMIISPAATGNPLLTPVSGKVVKTSKSKAKNNKAVPQTPTPNVGK